MSHLTSNFAVCAVHTLGNPITQRNATTNFHYFHLCQDPLNVYQQIFFNYKTGNIVFCPTNAGASSPPTILYQNGQPLLYNGSGQQTRTGLMSDNLILKLNPSGLDATLSKKKLTTAMAGNEGGGCQNNLSVSVVNDSHVNLNGFTNEKNKRKSNDPTSFKNRQVSEKFSSKDLFRLIKVAAI